MLHRGAGEHEYRRRCGERFPRRAEKGIPAEARQATAFAAAGRTGEYPRDCHRLRGELLSASAPLRLPAASDFLPFL